MQQVQQAQQEGSIQVREPVSSFEDSPTANLKAETGDKDVGAVEEESKKAAEFSGLWRKEVTSDDQPQP